MIRAEVRLYTDRSTNGWADTFLYIDGLCSGVLDVDYMSILHQCGTTWRFPLVQDLLLLGVTAYCIDKAVPRAQATDRWTREFLVTIPVHSAAFLDAAPILERCLSFLTGDRWHLDFRVRAMAAACPIVQPESWLWRQWSRNVEAISLFSGGLDSLIGVIDWLETHVGRILLVGHHDASVPGPLRDQRSLIPRLQEAYPGRVEAILARAGMRVAEVSETTFRARSFLFLTLALQPYTMITPRPTLLLPENGVIALNLPLTPSRRGSCSTRTTHPYYVALFEQWVAMLHVSDCGTPPFLSSSPDVTFVNPLLNKTKGEAVQECRNRALLRELFPFTVSCGKRAHRASWRDRTASHCGRCAPCMYRRAALHTIGWDVERFGSDICRGDVPLRGRPGPVHAGAADFQAMLALLRSDPSPSAIAEELLVNGSLTYEQLHISAEVACRGLEELRILLRDKATRAIRRHAGLLRRPAGREQAGPWHSLLSSSPEVRLL